MIKKYILLFLCVTLGIVTFAAQRDTIQISGRVASIHGLPVEALIVTALHPNDSSVITYSMTDEKGAYCMKFFTDEDEILVRLTGFNVKSEIKKTKAISKILDFEAIEESVTLREVQIKAQKLWGNRDTLNYLVAAYMTEHDRTIGDVLKQLPGITIEGGTIKYQGMPINRFYIENMDLLQGRYNIVTEGLKAEDVATVQVLENNEHVKALQDQVPPESAAINIKLKEKAKGVWTKSFGIGLGYDNDALWNCEANLMYFDKQQQHVIYYGNDNTGKGADRSYQYYGHNGLGPVILTDILYPGSAPVGSTLYNNEHAFHTSNLHRLNETAQLNYSLTYNHDIQKKSSYMQTTYLLPGSDTRIISEDISSRSTTNDANIRLSYENNAEKDFLCNTLDLSGQWYEANGTIQANMEEIRQHAYNRNLGFTNNTRWIHRTEENGFEITSKNTVQTTPQALSVLEETEARQEVDITRISSSNYFSLIKDLRRHRWSIVPTAALNVNYVGMNSMLRSPVSDYGDMRYLYSEANIGTMLRYVKNEFRLTFRLPLTLSYTDVKDEAHAARVLVSPSFNLLWKANDNWTLSCDGNYGMNQTSWNQLITSYIMNNYRTTSRYIANISNNYLAVLNAKLNFKDILSGFFAYVQGSVSRSWNDVIYGTTIDKNAHTIMLAEYMPHHDDSYSLTGNISKGFDWKKMRIEMNANYSCNNSRILRQSVTTDLQSTTYSVHGNVSASLFKAVRVSYDCHYTFSRSVSENYSHIIRTLGQNVNLDFSLIRNSLQANMVVRHTHNSGLNGKKNYAFMDCSIIYKTKKKMDFVLEADNIFNTHTFVSRLDTQLTEYFEVFYLRSRSIMLTLRLNL